MCWERTSPKTRARHASISRAGAAAGFARTKRRRGRSCRAPRGSRRLRRGVLPTKLAAGIRDRSPNFALELLVRHVGEGRPHLVDDGEVLFTLPLELEQPFQVL